MEYSSQEELFKTLTGAFNVKIRMCQDKYRYIKKEDIWNYLKLNKWCKDIDLSLSEMVNDIINVDIEKVDIYVKEHMNREIRNLYTD